MGRLRAGRTTRSSSSTPPTRRTSHDPDDPAFDLRDPRRRDVAIEFRSFCKTAGFTGVRCAFTVVPKTLKGKTADGAKRRAAPALEPPAHDEVQRRVLHRPSAAPRPSTATPARQQVRPAGRVLHDQRPDHPRGPEQCGPAMFWWRACSIRLGFNPGEMYKLAIFRSAFARRKSRLAPAIVLTQNPFLRRNTDERG